MKTIFTRVLFFLALSALVLPARADDSAAIHDRMSSRIGPIDALKAKGAIGESNTGLLQVRGSVSGDEQQMVSAENKDRSDVYASIAQKTHTSADAVARARAKKIADTSTPGVWLQDDGGNWYQKK